MAEMAPTKTAVVYFSYSGNNEVLAEDLGRRLNADVYKLEEQKRRTGLTTFLDVFLNRKPALRKLNVQMQDYDRVILIAPIWNYKIANPMRSFIEAEKKNLLNYAFITVCTGNRPEQKESVTKYLARTIGKRPSAVVELKVNDLLPEEKKNKLKYTSTYRIGDSDLRKFSRAIDSFVNYI